MEGQLKSNHPTQSDEQRGRLKRTLDRLFQRAKVGMNYKLSALEVGSLAQFILELTGQNAELAVRVAELTDETPTEEWSPMS